MLMTTREWIGLRGATKTPLPATSVGSGQASRLNSLNSRRAAAAGLRGVHPSQTDSGGARGRVFARVPTTSEEGLWIELVFEGSVPARDLIGFGDHYYLHPTTSSITPARSDTHCMASLISGASRPLCPVVDSSSLAVFSGVFTNKPGSLAWECSRSVLREPGFTEKEHR